MATSSNDGGTGKSLVDADTVGPLLRDGLLSAALGDDLLILDAEATQVMRISCTHATVDDIIATLDAHGMLAFPAEGGIGSPVDASTRGISRRRALQGAVAAGVVGVTVLALPNAAMAASPLAPAGITATPGIEQVTIAWTAIAATSYQVYFKRTSTDDSNYQTFGGAVAAGPVTVTGLTVGIEYSFYVVGTGTDNVPRPSDTVTATLVANDGITWTTRTSAADNAWRSVIYGNGLFVAVAVSGTSNRVMTSPDGITWTIRTSAADNAWRAVTYGNGLFVAVAETAGTGNQVMTSDNGITWTSRTSAVDRKWRGVTYGNSLFVAVAESGTGNRVMTSPDGITWTTRSSAADNNWTSVTYGGPSAARLFVAVAETTGVGTRVMTSDNGITWTTRASAADNDWTSVTYGNGLFVAVAASGTGTRVMTSPDGITWTSRTSAADNNWRAVSYGNGLFVAVAEGPGSGNRVMTSPDGITWTLQTSAANNTWYGVAYGNGRFVAVASSGTNNRVMTSG